MDGLLKDAGEGSIGSGGSKSRSVAALDVVLLGRENDRVSVVERVSDEAAACVATVPKDRIDVPATPEAIVPTSSMYSMSSDDTDVWLRERTLRVRELGAA